MAAEEESLVINNGGGEEYKTKIYLSLFSLFLTVFHLRDKYKGGCEWDNKRTYKTSKLTSDILNSKNGGWSIGNEWVHPQGVKCIEKKKDKNAPEGGGR